MTVVAFRRRGAASDESREENGSRSGEEARDLESGN